MVPTGDQLVLFFSFQPSLLWLQKMMLKTQFLKISFDHKGRLFHLFHLSTASIVHFIYSL